MSSNTKNVVAITLIGVGKVCGLCGIMLGYTNHRNVAALLLLIYGLLILTSVLLCISSLINNLKIEKSDKDVIRRLHEEGVLKHYLLEVCQNAN
jgi:hypothetical protein